MVTESIAEVRFLMTDKLKAKLEEVRSLLGQKGVGMGYAELFEIMSDVTLDTLKAKRFGKKRVGKASEESAKDSDKSSETRSATQPTSTGVASTNPRYLSREIKYKIWFRDRGRCANCGTQSGLNFDHN